MQAQETRARHSGIVEKQEDAGNAGADFDIRDDRARGEAIKKALSEGTASRTGLRDRSTDHGMIHESDQASHHRKRTGNPGKD